MLDVPDPRAMGLELKGWALRRTIHRPVCAEQTGGWGGGGTEAPSEGSPRWQSWQLQSEWTDMDHTQV